MAGTAYEAGYIEADPLVMHACQRSLSGMVALCGEKPQRTVGRFDSEDQTACPLCVTAVGEASA
jgi:hypothetical protein